MRNIFLVILTLLLPNPILAQDGTIVTDKSTQEELQKDFDMRHSTIPDIEVNWFTSDYGYYGKYSINENSFISRYDKRMDFIETLVKKEWNGSVSRSLRDSFLKSEYRDWSVTSFWEVVEPDGPGYYLELLSKNGNATGIWTDGRGTFTTIPNKVD